MTIDSENDVKYLKAIGRICAQALRTMIAQVHTGMTTGELDEVGRAFLESQGAHSAPQVMYNFPGVTCISVSPVIAHGIPGDYVLKEGDLIHVDVSAEMDGYFADTGASVVVGKETHEQHKLIESTREVLAKALHAARAGRLLNDIGKTVQQEAGKRGFGVIYDLTGHGIGHKLHEPPSEVLNFYNPRDRRVLNDGLVLAIEPFLTTGRGRVVEGSDGWSLSTVDKTVAAQFEHTIIVTKHEPIVLTL